MKQNILLTCAALAAVCIITAFLLSVSDMTSSAPAPNAQEAGESVQGVERTADPGQTADCQYYLRDYQGKLAVFLPDKQTPEIVFDVYLSTLPPMTAASCSWVSPYKTMRSWSSASRTTLADGYRIVMKLSSEKEEFLSRLEYNKDRKLKQNSLIRLRGDSRELQICTQQH